MSYTAYEILEDASVAGLNTLITTAIAAGKQPVGSPSLNRVTRRYIQAVAAGTPGAFFESPVITVTTGELLALNATPKTLLAATGAGTFILPLFAELFLDYNSAAYAAIHADDNLTFKYTGAAGTLLGTVETTGFLDQTADQHRHFSFATGDLTPTANAALVLHMANGEVTTGDSPLKIKIYYRVVTLLT